MIYGLYTLLLIVLVVNGALALHCWNRWNSSATRPEERNYD